MKTSAEPFTLSARQLLCVLLGFSIFASLAAAQGDPPPAPTAPPYVFVLLDTSGSMNWTPICNHLDAASDGDPYDGACTSVCPLGDPACARVCPSYGCSEYEEAPPDPASMAPIVVDNRDFGSFTWSPPTAPLQRMVRANFDPVSDLFDDTDSYLPGSTFVQDPLSDSTHYAAKTSARSFTFNRPLDHSGLWHVYAFWAGATANATNTRIDINYFDGVAMRTKVIQVDQRVARQSFAFLATLDFRSNGALVPASVVIRNNNELNQLVANGDIVADAVAFVPVPVQPPESLCVASSYLCRQPLCPEGDCRAPMAGDDPASKFFQVKQALHEVIAESAEEPKHLGFATFEQDNARVRYKHWSYRVKAWQPTIFNFPDGFGITVPFPSPGSIDVFGTGGPYNNTGRTTSDNNGFHCATSTNITPGSVGFDENHLVGCMSAFPADLRDLWEVGRLRGIPKLGKGGNVETSLFLRAWTGSAYQVYRLDWEPYSSSYKLGQPTFRVSMDIIRCNNLLNDPACSSPTYSTTLVSNAVVEYDLVGEQIPFELDLGRPGVAAPAFFDNQQSMMADNTCEGIEPNEDWINTPSGSADDAWFSYPYKHPSLLDPRGDLDPSGSFPIAPRKTVLDRGDFVPLDWLDDNQATVGRYLSPNDVAGFSSPAGSAPDYRVGVYFHDEVLSVDSPTTLDRKLRLRDDVYQSSPGVWAPTANPPLAFEPNQRPLVAAGSTPIFRSVNDFRDWYLAFKPYAQAADAEWAVREKYLLVITDGEESCDVATPVQPICSQGNAVEMLSAMALADRVRTYAVGFATPDGSDSVSCIAANGRTGPNNTPGSPAFPRNFRELKENLEEIFDLVVFGPPADPIWE